MPQKVVLASGNAGKIREFTALLKDYPLQIVPQNDFDIEEAEETGSTFVENAIIKARHAARLTGLAAIADDSGIAVDALGGQPGVYSSRFAGENATDKDNVDKLLRSLKDVNPEQRTACFHCVIVYMESADDPTPIICQGEWRGHINTEVSGEEGFGYDPIFWLPALNKTAAQLPANEKNQISHRASAMKLLMNRLSSKFSESAS